MEEDFINGICVAKNISECPYCTDRCEAFTNALEYNDLIRD